jgi:PTH1 family peptidyl-tRNA hydrolase
MADPEATDPSSGVWLVVGLGNPGPDYAGTRHNVGYLVTDELARRMGSPFRAHKSGRAEVVEGRLTPPGQPGPRVVLARPRCYMNESGGAVKALASFYKVPVDRIVAIHDELDIPFGTLRVKLGGGDNGHNGLRSLRSSSGTGEFYRVRAGVGRPPDARTLRTSCCRTTPLPSARSWCSRSTVPPTPSSPCSKSASSAPRASSTPDPSR